MISTLSSGLVSDNLGRKKALIIGQMLILFGWSLLYFAWNFQILLTARCVMGIGVGVAYPNICMYLSEISLVCFALCCQHISVSNVIVNAIFTDSF